MTARGSSARALHLAPRPALLLLALVLALLRGADGQTPPPPPADAATMATALVAFRNALRGPAGTQLATWTGANCSASWAGVTCSAGNMPTALSLAGLGLAGTLSCDVAAVTSLTSLDLARARARALGAGRRAPARRARARRGRLQAADALRARPRRRAATRSQAAFPRAWPRTCGR
jgi:hypothetical protein